MAHEVKFSIPERALGNADIEFSVKINGKKFGTLKISRGALVWVKKDHTKGLKIKWDKLDEVMEANGTAEK